MAYQKGDRIIMTHEATHVYPITAEGSIGTVINAPRNKLYRYRELIEVQFEYTTGSPTPKDNVFTIDADYCRLCKTDEKKRPRLYDHRIIDSEDRVKIDTEGMEDFFE